MQKIVIKNTFYAQASQLVRVVLQAVYFILIARALSPVGYGAYVSVLALVSFFVAFSSWGSGRLMIRDIALDADGSDVYWGGSLTTLLLIGWACVVLVCLIGMIVLPAEISLALIFYITVADCLFAAIVNINGYVFQALQKIQYMGLCGIVLSLCRTTGVFVFLWVNFDTTAENWAMFYMVSSCVAAVITTLFVLAKNGFPKFNFRYLKMLGDGFSFAAATSANQFSNDIDKVMLSAMVGQAAVGIYGAAYKLINISFSPILALLTATYARFFEKGNQGIHYAFRYALRLSFISLPVGLIIALAFILLAPVVPVIMGDEYAASVTAMRWLAVLPMIKIFQYFGGDALSGAGLQRLRMMVLIAFTVVNVCLNFILIPQYSWKGAIVATLICDSLIAICIWGILIHYVQKERMVIINEKA